MKLYYKEQKMILAGKRFDFIILAGIAITMYILMRKAERGDLPKMRTIPMIGELDNIVGRAAEMGRPVHYTTGYGGLHDEWAVMCVAGLAILSKVAELCGKYQVPLQFTCFRGYLVPIGRDILKTGYEKGGNPDMYSDEMVTYYGEDQVAYIGAIINYFETERPAVSMIFGAIQMEMNQVLMQSARYDAISLAGTPRLYYQGKMALMADYCLLGEELYVVGASISGDPVQLGCIQGEDWAKVLVIILFVIGAIMVGVGSGNLFGSFLTW
jgi:hypothetical protein